ncbi:hypothetical protein ACFQ11_16120, partial [Actinomadura sediminis]
ATALLGGDATRDDAPPAPPVPPVSRPASGPSGRPGGGVPRRALAIGAGVLAAAVLIAFVGYKVIGGGPPEKLATAFSDTFASSDSGWYTFGERQLYANDRYRMRTSGSDSSVSAFVPKGEVNDFPDPVLATVTVAAREGPADARFGMTCRSNDDGARQYVFLVRNDGQGALLRKVNGDIGTKDLATVDSSGGWDEEGPNEIQIACEGRDGGESVRLRLWVNGERVIDETDGEQPLPNGWIGLRIERGGNQAEDVTAEFDDFDMSKILE